MQYAAPPIERAITPSQATRPPRPNAGSARRAASRDCGAWQAGAVTADDVQAQDFSFDASSYEPLTLTNGKRLLRRGTLIMSPQFFRTPPDLPTSLADPDPVRRHVAQGIASQNAALIDFEVVDLDGCLAMRTVAKVRAEGRAMMYLGAIQLHFEPCWWCVNMEAREHGTTGVREAAVLMLMTERGDAPQPSGPPVVLDSLDDLPLPEARMLPSDDEEWDEKFPDHPLSLVRAAQREIVSTARVSKRARSLPPFHGANTAD